jgi:hypothetical protein
MPLSDRKKFSKTIGNSSDTREESQKEALSEPRKPAGIDCVTDLMNCLDISKKVYHSSILPKKLSNSNSAKTRVVGGISRNLGSYSFSDKRSKSRDFNLSRISKKSSSLLRRNVNSSGFLTRIVTEKGPASKFPSAFVDKNKLVMHKQSRPLSRKEVNSNNQKLEHFSHATALRLFEALSKEPMEFLHLHTSFGVSKRTVRGFVRNGWLTETWGRGGVGIRFRLSEKGRDYLKKLEEYSKYETKPNLRNLIHLKNRAF